MIQSNRRVRFLASVQMAILLFIILMLAIGLGTLIESRYNAEYARRMVYQTWPFALLGLLFAANIFLSTLTRWPWKKKHLGFLVTHLGLIILIAGSFATALWGIDGQLFVEENQSAHTVWSNERTLEILEKSGQKSVPIPLGPSWLTGRVLGLINVKFDSSFKIAKVFEYVDASGLSADGFRINIKSPMFNQNIDLTTAQPEIDLGPARFVWRLEKQLDDARSDDSENERTPIQETAGLKVEIQTLEGKIVDAFDPIKEKNIKAQHLKIKVQKVLSRATINGAGIVEGTRENPAVELLIESGAQKIREVLFTRFPQFSLLKPGVLPFRFILTGSPGRHTEAGSVATVKANQERGTSSLSSLPQFTFFVENETPWVEFSKNGVLGKVRLDQGKVTAPWMGIEVTALQTPNHQARPPIEVKPPPKSKELPPSALELVSDQQKIWITEGEYKSIQTAKGRVDLYYGPQPIRLPFSIELLKFKRENYLGTDTAKSFESQVKVGGGTPTTIKMNTPFKHQGYTIYQSAYQELPDGRYVSIFSVNRDPGRWIKYLGTFLTALGILIFIRSKKQRRQVTV